MKNSSWSSRLKVVKKAKVKTTILYSKTLFLKIAVFLLLIYQSLYAQQNGKIYGMTKNSIFSMNSDGTELVSNFPFADEGVVPQGELVEGSDGKLYGVTSSGGQYGFGVIYSVSKDGTAYTPVYDFNYLEGAFPQEGITRCSDGRLYGMTRQGGNYDYGVIFSVSQDGTDYSVVHHFNTDTGRNPEGGILEGSDGKLYGVTLGGGIHDFGVIFTVFKDGTGYTVLHNFNGSGGGSPYAKLLEGSDGKLYGSAYSGGAYNRGLLFSISKEGTEFTILHQFNLASGSNPRASLIESTDGKLYGVTIGGGSNGVGAVFSMNKDGSSHTVLHDFVASEGYAPLGRIIEGSDGKLYGTTTGGCCYQYYGTIYSLSKDGMGYSILHNFNRTDGSSPGAGLFEDGNGRLYGITRGGGNDNSGVFFSIEQDGTGFSLLKSFKRSLQGGLPAGGLVNGGEDHFYGTTSKGGTEGLGVVFSWSKTQSKYTVIHNFDNSSGGNPQKNLVVSGDGNLYGVLGEDNDLFKVSKEGTGFKILYDFAPNSFSGYFLEGSDGKLYGAEFGTKANSGGIFSLSKEGSEYTLVADFASFNSSFAVGGVAEGSDGNLYGVTGDGGVHGEGVIYSVSKSGNDLKVLHDFDLANGIRPTGLLIEGSDGKLYGMTKSGGAFNAGGIFSVTKDGTEFLLLYSFDGQKGMEPLGGLTEGSDGKLYGMTSRGGEFGQGVAFSISRDGTNYSILQSFNGSNGYQPQNSTLLLDKQSQTISFPAIEIKSIVDVPFLLGAFSSSGLPVSFTSSNPSVATISGNEVTIVGVGETEITAIQEGDENYEPATPVSQVLKVGKASQEISFTALPEGKSVGESTFILSASSSSGLPVSFLSSNLSVATISGSEVTIVGVGETEITAIQEGDENYEPATPVSQILVIENMLTAIQDFTSAKRSVLLYPNPAVLGLNIETEGFVFGMPLDITIIDVAGCKVISLTSLEKKLNLDVSPLPSGVYYIRIGQGTREMGKRFIKK